MLTMIELGLREEDVLLQGRVEVAERVSRLAGYHIYCRRCGQLRQLVSNLASLCIDPICPQLKSPSST